MAKSVFVLCFIAVLLIAESYCFRSERDIILPTFRPPPRRPVLRTARDAGDEPLWLYKGDDIPRAPPSGEHPILPTYIDDVKLDPNRRYARSLSEPSQEYHQRFVRSFDSKSSKHHGGGHSTSGGSRDTGATHPGYNRRNS